MDMPVVSTCEVDACAYNRQRACHALAITVGDGVHARCDTFMAAGSKGGVATATGRVGACKVSACRHNMDLECQAKGITVGYVQDEADCLTYAPR